MMAQYPIASVSIVWMSLNILIFEFKYESVIRMFREKNMVSL